MPNIEPKSSVKGDVLVLLAMAMFASYALFLRLCPQIPPAVFLFAFQAVGALSFAIIAFRQGFPEMRGKGWFLLALAVVALANDLLYFSAFRATTVANAAVSHQMVSVFLLVLAPLLLGEKTRKNEWIAFVFSIIGIAVLYRNGITVSGKDFWGITMGVGSGLFYALLVILYRYLPQQGLSISVINFWRYLFSTVLLVPFAPMLKSYRFAPSDLIPLAGFGLLFAVIASGIHNTGISKTRSLHVSILGKSEPVFAVIYAYYILHETPATDAVIGGILIVGSSVWLTLREGGYKNPFWVPKELEPKILAKLKKEDPTYTRVKRTFPPFGGYCASKGPYAIPCDTCGGKVAIFKVWGLDSDQKEVRYSSRFICVNPDCSEPSVIVTSLGFDMAG